MEKTMNAPRSLGLFLGLVASVSGLSASAGWQDMLKSAEGITGGGAPPAAAPAAAPAISGVSQAEAGTGLQQALVKGVERVVKQLGAKDGYLGNPQVRIPLPSQLSRVEGALRMMGQNAYADEFVETMNRAAEQAVHEAAPVFVDAITSMSFDDALGILRGPNDAATQYLRRTSGPALRERMLPIVESATEANQVTSAYKALVDKAMGSSPFLKGAVDMDAADVDGYVTDRALDGLYKLLALQEQGIRAHPTEWTTDTLKKVFGSLGG
jgi:hypothetical protein